MKAYITFQHHEDIVILNYIEHLYVKSNRHKYSDNLCECKRREMHILTILIVI